MRKLGIRLLAASLTLGAGTIAWNGINEGWFYRLCGRAYDAVRDNSPEPVRDFIERHPVYTAGLEGIAAGLVAGAAAVEGGRALYRMRRK